MRIVHINKSDQTGGAAIAAHRIVSALQKQGVAAQMLTQEGHALPYVRSLDANKLLRARNFAAFVAERLYFLPSERDKSVRFAFSPAWAGVDISRHPLVREADVLHLHWFNQGFLSIAALRKLFALGKPIVWTMHDMWAFTGGCHYTDTCKHFQSHCGVCPMLKKPSATDLSFRILKQKEFVAQHPNLQMVACSNWLAEIAQSSSLFATVPVVDIPNSIDTVHFAPTDRLAIRHELGIEPQQNVLLFGAANIDDPRKGFQFVREALLTNYTLANKPLLLLFGKVRPETLAALNVPYKHVPYADAEMLRKLYNATDLLLLPSLQDNLPNTAMEALSCGTPVVAFRTGGIPEMVKHGQTGYLVEQGNSRGLYEGIEYVLAQKTAKHMRMAAREHVLANYSPQVVAGRYSALYESLLAR